MATSKDDSGYIMAKPDTEIEINRLDLQHQIWVLTLENRLFTSKLHDDVRNILDIGTGTGAWSVAVAEQIPNTEVVGTDTTLPTIDAPPVNLQLVKSDAEKPWPFPPNHFDFIHGRMLVGGIHDWPGFLGKCWQHLAPGGHLELLDTCGPYSAEDPQATSVSSPFMKLGSLLAQSWVLEGLDHYHSLRHAYRMESLGFVNIEEEERRWPLGEWPSSELEKKIGGHTLRNMQMFNSKSVPIILTHSGFMSEDEARQVVSEAEEDLVDNHMKKRFFIIIKVTRARKPGSV